jgi:hypothetical protein
MQMKNQTLCFIDDDSEQKNGGAVIKIKELLAHENAKAFQ